VSHTLDRLIYMANQIARNLAFQHDPEAAVADHIGHFWDPRMKALIFDHLATGGAGLDAIAAAALHRLSRHGAPEPQSQATVFNAVHEAGGSDAG
jgi:formate dehydrogenase subunit delta